MKKQEKKLTLAKDTIRNLDKAELPAIAGGLSTSCPSYDFICKQGPSHTSC
jgi:hypothetical protein